VAGGPAGAVGLALAVRVVVVPVPHVAARRTDLVDRVELGQRLDDGTVRRGAHTEAYQVKESAVDDVPLPPGPVVEGTGERVVRVGVVLDALVVPVVAEVSGGRERPAVELRAPRVGRRLVPAGTARVAVAAGDVRRADQPGDLGSDRRR